MADSATSQSTGVSIPNSVEFMDGDEPPSLTPDRSRRHPAWANVPESDWNNWRWQSQHAIRHPKQLVGLLPLSEVERSAIETLQAHYKLAIPPYYFSLIDPHDPHDPIRLQSLPSSEELAGAHGEDGEEDPLDEEKDSPVPGLTHRYPDRALLVTTHVCTMYCRFCTRKRATMKRGGWDAVSRDDHRMVEYIRAHPEIRDVILSGGDPLTLPAEKLEFFIRSLNAIPHLDVIRIGTRVPVTLPQRLDDDELMAVLSLSDKLWIQTHFNHAREVTPEVKRGCDRLRLRGMPINNHAVLLKGVNDSLAAQRELCRALLRIKVRPYYLFHCDPVTGAGHFRTPVWKGIEIIEGLRGHISGLGVPTYVVDAPRGGGKIPLMPNYLLSASNDSVVLRNYEGMIIHYHPTGAPPEAQPHVVTQGVSALLEGQSEVLVPENTPRINRRKARALETGPPAQAPPKKDGVKNGGNGHTAAEIRASGNGKAKASVDNGGTPKQGPAH